MTYFEAAAHGQGASGSDGLRVGAEPLELRQWTVKNLESAVVDKARAAAKRKGMKISSWVAATIENAADAQADSSPTPPSSLSLDLGEILNKIEEIRREDQHRIERIERDISLLVKNQHSMLSELLSRCFEDRK